MPPAGIVVPDDVAKELTEGVAALGKKIEDVRGALKTKPALAGLLPDVRIFHKAVDWALRYNEFFDAKQFAAA